MSWHLHKGHYIWRGDLPVRVQRELGTIKALRDGEPIGHALRASVPNYRAILATGMAAEAPTQDKYWHFAGQHKPMSHQRRTVASTLQHHKSFVLDDPGTGKTLSAIWAMQAMRERNGHQRHLIVAPMSIVHGVWCNELFLHTDWKVADLTKRSRERRLQMAADERYEVFLINPESLHSVVEVLPLVDGVIVDEFTAFKSVSAKRSKSLKQLLKRDDPWLVMMSGTPAPQGPIDAYNPIKLVNPKAERMTQRYWRDLTEIKISEFTWVARPNAQETLTKWLQPGTRTSREEALDLPLMSTYTRHYELTSAQKKAIKQMRDDALAEFEGGTITAANAAVAASKALQILTGSVRYEDERTGEQKMLELDATPWVEAVQEVVSERHEPVLIFVPFRAAAGKLAKALDCPIIHGDIDRDTRASIYNQINRGEVQAVVAVAATMSHGLTLTGSNCVLWALPPASAEQYQQANARVYRNGQTKPVDIIHLVAHNFVQALFQRTDARVKLQQAVLDALATI